MDSRSILNVVGTNLREVRQASGLTLAQLSKAARDYGLPWSTGRVGDIEAGRGAVTVQMIVGLALVLTDLSGQAVTPADLLRSDDPVELGDGFVLTGHAFHEVFTGVKTALNISDVVGAVDEAAELVHRGVAAHQDLDKGVTAGQVRQALRDRSLADERAAQKLGMSADEFLAACLSLWGRMMSVEVEARVDEGASAQKKGRVTRVLLDELRAVTSGDH